LRPLQIGQLWLQRDTQSYLTLRNGRNTITVHGVASDARDSAFAGLSLWLLVGFGISRLEAALYGDLNKVFT